MNPAVTALSSIAPVDDDLAEQARPCAPQLPDHANAGTSRYS